MITISNCFIGIIRQIRFPFVAEKSTIPSLQYAKIPQLYRNDAK